MNMNTLCDLNISMRIYKRNRMLNLSSLSYSDIEGDFMYEECYCHQIC